MALVPMHDLLVDAVQREYALGYLEAWDDWSLGAVVQAAEELDSPIIVGFGCSLVNDGWLCNRGIRTFACLARIAAEAAKVPVAVMLNEARTFQHVELGLRHGFNALMLSTAHLEFEENVQMTRKVVEVAHSAGCCVEAELGILEEDENPQAKGIATEPDLAGEFVRKTGIDMLAVSVGNVHRVKRGSVCVDLDSLQRIHEQAEVPLVLHGGTGLEDEQIPDIIQRGVAKINVGSIFRRAFLAELTKKLANQDYTVEIDALGRQDENDLFWNSRCAVKEIAAKLMVLYGSAGKARDLRVR
jgi:fructose-bisphosphate aldolase class II